MLALSMALLWGFTALNVVGLGVGKWVNNLGGIGAMGATLTLLAVAAAAFNRSGGEGLHSLPDASAFFRP